MKMPRTVQSLAVGLKMQKAARVSKMSENPEAKKKLARLTVLQNLR